MAMQVIPQRIGVDVSKHELMYCREGETTVQSCPNTRPAIRTWLRSLSSAADFALEATNDFHYALALEAHRHGHRVYLLNGYRLSRYRDSIGGRAKTDASDACLLVRYLAHEQNELHPWTPPPAAHRRLQQLLRRRAQLVQSRVALQQSLQGLQTVPGLKVAWRALLQRLNQLDALLQTQIQATLAETGWDTDSRRCQQLEGVGPLTGAGLAMTYHRGSFAHSDAFIAFLGLDVRVRDSGQSRRRRKLTKQGDPELRRLLYLAAMETKAKPAWQAFYQRHIDRGLAPIQAINVLARKLARVAFALMRNQIDYQPRIPCAQT
jgi:transposase